MVVFNSHRVGKYSIRISNNGKFRVGLKLTSRSSAEPIEIRGVGFMYNTNVSLLPPLEQIAPETTNAIVLPDTPTVYNVIEIRFDYRDRNGEPEDVTLREVRWYINGQRVSYLDNLTHWNDIENPNDPLYRHALTFTLAELKEGETAVSRARKNGESILKPGDLLYYTIRVSDGELFSEVGYSDAVTIAEDKPQLDKLAILAEQPSGAISTTLTSRDTAFVDYAVLGDSASNLSEIAWFLNGDEFKRGIVGEVEGIDRVVPGEDNGDGDIILQLGNEIYVEVTPQTNAASGDVERSDTVLIRNAHPVVSNARIGPSAPRASQNLVLSYTFSDADIALGDPTQDDLSTIKWFKKSSEKQQQFTEVPELAGRLTVESTNIRRGEVWTAVIVPFDGIDIGSQVTANSVIIR
ncbi:MAG: hypothetical protein HC888_01310 [Candidatus Competibacteraceae bacterium]|nr:hypothetical protein [Candidatus Competibacteraceae bacterium]